MKKLLMLVALCAFSSVAFADGVRLGKPLFVEDLTSSNGLLRVELKAEKIGALPTDGGGCVTGEVAVVNGGDWQLRIMNDAKDEVMLISANGEFRFSALAGGVQSFRLPTDKGSGSFVLATTNDVASAIAGKFTGQTFDLSTEDAMFESMTNIIIQLGGVYTE